MKKLLAVLRALGPLACIAIVLAMTSVGWMSMRLFGLGGNGRKTGGASADIVAIVQKLSFKPLFIFDSGVLVARPPKEFLKGDIDEATSEDIEEQLKERATLELEYKATSGYTVDFKQISNVGFEEMDGRTILRMTLPQPKMDYVHWTNEGDSTKWDQKHGDNKDWVEFLDRTHNRQLFVSAAVRRNYDNDTYRDMARKQTEKILRVLFGSLVVSPEKDIFIEWKQNVSTDSSRI